MLFVEPCTSISFKLLSAILYVFVLLSVMFCFCICKYHSLSLSLQVYVTVKGEMSDLFISYLSAIY